MESLVVPNQDGSLPAIGEGEALGEEQVHAGFLKAYHEMHPGIMQFLKNRNKRHLPVLCVGHSMGGSLATICARYLSLVHGSWDLLDASTHGMVALYTFGSPRTGNDAFVTGMNEAVLENWRLVCEDDMVPSLPHEDCGCWARLLCSCYKCNSDYAKPTGYRHVGTEVLLTVDGMLMIDPCFAEERFMRNFRTRCWRPEKIQNHQMSRYRLCIKEWVRRLHGDNSEFNVEKVDSQKMLSPPPW